MDEDEAALLAELRAISNQSAASRFDSSEDDTNNGGGVEVPNTMKVEDTNKTSDPEEEKKSKVTPSTSPDKVQDENAAARERQKKKNTPEVPPWKRKRKPVAKNPMDNVDIVIATPTKKTQSPSPAMVGEDEAPVSTETAVVESTSDALPTTSGFGQMSNFGGSRGGDAHDEELLALLKGVSNKSGATDRFAGGEEVEESSTAAEPTPIPENESSAAKAPEPEAAATKVATSPNRRKLRDPTELPPWKQGKNKKSVAASGGVAFDVVVASPPPKKSAETPEEGVVLGSPTETAGAEAVPQEKPIDQSALGEGGRFKQESTFQGPRGGDALDDELLALLKGVSAKSGVGDRFASSEDDNNNNNLPDADPISQPAPTKVESKAASNRKELPPWKRPKAKQSTPPSDDLDVVVQHKPLTEKVEVTAGNIPSAREVIEEPFSEADVVGGGGDFKQSSTFQGERGGDAHDEELLALIRGVSAKSGSAGRFAREGGEDAPAPASELPMPTNKPMKSESAKKAARDTSVFPPWKRDKVAATSNNSDVDVVVATKPAPSRMEPFPSTDEAALDEDVPVEGGRGNFKQDTSFEGERGGEAHDEELLALLRGVSSKGGTDRFGEEQPSGSTSAPTPKTPAPEPTKAVASIKEAAPRPPPAFSANSAGPTPFPTGDEEEAIVVTKDDLPAAFSDSNWKVRKAAYRVLNDAILEAGKSATPGILDANSIVSGFEDMIPKLLAEKNAAALENALQAVASYTDMCQGASSRADGIMTALFKGNAFSSPRPSAAKLTSSLVIKLIEVGSSSEAVTIVVTSLVSQGLSSKKPKVVQLSASLILEATYSFGAGCLPLESIVSALPKVLSHTNKKVRDCGMEILAEFCRALGSKTPMEDVIGKMQKSQVKDLDSLLAKQADPTPLKIGLRCERTGPGRNSAPVNDNLAALQARGEELENERFANRPAVNLVEALQQTDFSSKLKLAKWSEKVGALDIALACGGEKPYKLVQPTRSCNYTPLISDLKGLLSHTHFAVVSKSMAVLSMLAGGVGGKLYPNLRPLLPKLLQLSKDKKLTKAVSSCLDAFFGTILGYEHLLDSENALLDATNESKEKNALARTCAVDFLERCISRGASAGPRAALTGENVKACAKFAVHKLDDSDANVRKAALKTLESLQKLVGDHVQNAVGSVVEGLQQSNPRAYKSLMKSGGSKSKPASSSSAAAKAAAPTMQYTPQKQAKGSTRPPPPTRHSPVRCEDSMVSKDAAPIARTVKPRRTLSVSVDDANQASVPSIEDAIAHCASLGIPLWDEQDENEGGVLVGIQSTKWQFRHAAIKELSSFVSSRPMLDSCSEIERDTMCLTVLVKEHTRGFKESNMNVVRSMLELFTALCDFHAKADCPFPRWVSFDASAVAVEKIADRKLSSLSKSLLLSICVVHPSDVFLPKILGDAEKLRAPAAHEEFLFWLKSFFNEFGAASVSPVISNIVAFIKTESCSKNIKVKRAALGVFGVLHAQLGPPFKSVVLATMKETLVHDDIEKTFTDHPFDPSSCNVEWPKVSNFARSGEEGSESKGIVEGIDIPTTDLMSEIPSDCISKMGSKDGKTAWKARKYALEDVEAALRKGNGLIDASRLRPLVDLLRAMKERLSDSQSNLKPLAARLIGQVLGSVQGEAQGKLGKIVYGSLINAAMNDKRKIMNDASMEALKAGTSLPAAVGGGLNESSLEPFVVALTSELEESEFKAAGIAGVLVLTQTFTKSLPDLDNVTSQRGESLGGRFASMLVDGLSSSKSDIRSASEALLSDCLMDRVFAISTAKKCAGRLVPAKQRTVGTILFKISSSLESEPTEREDDRHPSPASMKARTGPPAHRPESRSARATSKKNAAQEERSVPAARQQVREETPKHHHSDEKRISATSNPLVYEAGPSGIQRSRAATRSLTWPEYPEEPSGSTLYNGLKKAWSPIVPPETTKKLFPDSGIRKQDDALGGFELLTRGISLEKAGEGMAVTEQLSFILRWTAFVMARKESSVGLTSLLEMLLALLSHLRDLKYEFSDLEATIFLPFLLEKASVAKGRFKDIYMDLIAELKAGHMIVYKKFGPLVCVPIMESSAQAKARLLACQECYGCVESVGLSGIGKKGVLVVAKSLSDEKLPENRSALLDLMALLVSRMNNDIQRLSKICGTSLSNKARTLVEERMRKIENDGGLPSPPKTTGMSSGIPTRTGGASARTARQPRPNQSTPVAKGAPSRSKDAPAVTTIATTSDDGDMTFEDELPALDLRLGARAAHITPTKSSGLQQPSPPSSLPRLNFSDRGALSKPVDSSPVVGSSSSYPDSSPDPAVANLFNTSSGSNSESSALRPSFADSGSSESIGAAASLRARLLKIREKNQGGASRKHVQVAIEPATSNDDGFETAIAPSVTESKSSDSQVVSAAILNDYLAAFRNLAEKTPPLDEQDCDLLECTENLKILHASVTNQTDLALRIDASSLPKLREGIKERISEVFEALTLLIGFGFNCHESSKDAGLSVALLSVNLASLMAVFRSPDLSTLINVDDLAILIKEAGKALLDPRLASPSSTSSGSSLLNEATSDKMVRAINKLAVQAATEATRANSILALFSLLQQLATNEKGEDILFNTRLSRIVAKLLGRVIRTEEGIKKGLPFESPRVDMEAIICCLDDTLVSSERAEADGNTNGAAVTRKSVKTVVGSILKARGEYLTFTQELTDLEIDPESSELGKMVSSCSTELGLLSTSAAGPDIASLVSAVGSAAQGSERDEAVNALKEYKKLNGDTELNKHLENVS
ncbi:MAG: hypothetical protein SGILL_001267, partial [Bacillariaceae sp.]